MWHKARIDEITQKVLREIDLFKRLGKKLNKTKIAESLNMSREHLSRKYAHLFYDM